MAKPNRRNLKGTPHLSGLFQACQQDLEEFLTQRDRDHLSDAHNLLDCHSYITAELEVDSATSNYLRYCALRQLDALFKKNVDLPGTSALARKETAFGKFHASEQKCKRTNKRLRFYQSHRSRIPNRVAEVLDLARSISEEIYGPLTRIAYHKICTQTGFGPGFNFGSSDQEHRHLYYKVAGPHTSTEEALPYFKVLLNHSEHWKQSLIDGGSTYSKVRGNRVTAVPKTAVTDRTIAIEPSVNVYLQKGVDSYLKGRLRRFGVHLTNQARNYPPARDGSQRPLHAATVDLSSASDNISTEIVKLLTPSLWYTLMDDLRSKEYTFDKGRSWQKYEKFSSMGNAFTFPLETIIFYSIAKACTIVSGGNLKVLRVYGDDIIIDPCAALLLYEVLYFAGFTPNEEKSFIFGNFRETCGSDFLSGVDTRPVYVKRLPRNDVEVYNLFNRLLNNRVGFRLHNTCAFLYGCVRVPLIGPPDLPQGEKLAKWYAGKNVIYDHYFHAPSDSGLRFLRFDKDLQRHVWRIRITRFKPMHLDTSSWSLQMWYLVFLLGLQGNSHVDSVSRFKKINPTVDFYRWEDPPWRPWLFDYLEVQAEL